MKNLLDYINKYTLLDPEAEELLQRFARVEVYAKNALILKPGQYCDRIWFLAEGMVRKYFLDEGDELTLWIHCENEIFTSLNSYFYEEPSSEYLQACEAVKLISISRENSRKLEKNPYIMAFTNRMMGEQFARVDINSREFRRLDARAKYAFLREVAPEMIKRAKLGHIASIMGVHPSTLSRIRRAG